MDEGHAKVKMAEVRQRLEAAVARIPGTVDDTTPRVHPWPSPAQVLAAPLVFLAWLSALVSASRNRRRPRRAAAARPRRAGARTGRRLPGLRPHGPGGHRRRVRGRRGAARAQARRRGSLLRRSGPPISTRCSRARAQRPSRSSDDGRSPVAGRETPPRTRSTRWWRSRWRSAWPTRSDVRRGRVGRHARHRQLRDDVVSVTRDGLAPHEVGSGRRRHPQDRGDARTPRTARRSAREPAVPLVAHRSRTERRRRPVRASLLRGQPDGVVSSTAPGRAERPRARSARSTRTSTRRSTTRPQSSSSTRARRASCRPRGTGRRIARTWKSTRSARP